MNVLSGGGAEARAKRTRYGAFMITGLLAVSLTVVGKLLGFGRDVAISFFFGANNSTDAFFIANMIPGIMWTAIFVTINVVFLPLYISRRLTSERDAETFANEAVQIYLILALAVAVACALGSGAIVHWTAPGAPAATLQLAQTLTLIMAVGFVFSGYVAVQNAIQQAHGLYQLPLMVPVINNLLAIVGVVLAAKFGDIKIAIVAAVLAWVLQAPIQRFQTRRFYSTVWGLAVKAATLRRLALLSAPVMLGTFLDQINIYVGIYLAGGLGVGAITHLNYASRLAMFLATTFSMLVSYFLFPRLAADAAGSDDRRTARTLAFGMLLVAAATAPAAIVGVVMRHDVVGLVYGRGALSAAGVASTATAFAYFSIGIVFVALREIFNRLLFSHQRMVAPLVIGIVASVTNFAISKWLSGTMGTAGIALGASTAAVVYLVGQVLVVVAWKPRLISRELMIGLAAIAVAVIPAWFALNRLLPVLASYPILIRLLAAGAIFTLVFVATLAPLAWRSGLRRLA